ncbi:MAG: hypothetical protein JO224_03530 [Pelomonas sp.]|nr:hypothetical protein [Roseateles sp.]
MSAAALTNPGGAFAGLSPLRAALQSLANSQTCVSWGFWALLFVGVPAASALIKPKLGLLLLAAFVVIALIGLWGALVSSLLNQNHPTLARLVPGQPRRLRLVLVLSYLALSVASELLGRAFDEPRIGLYAAATLAYFATGVRWPLTWVTTALFGFGPLLVRKLPLDGRMLVGELLLAAASPLGLACVLAAASVYLAGFVRDGGGAHGAAYERLQKRRRALKASVAGEAVQSPWFLGTLSLRGYGRSFERTLARAAAGRAGFDRVMLALGPQSHPATMLQGVVVLTLLVAVGVIGLWLAGSFQHSAQVGEGFANAMFGLLGVMLSALQQVHASMVRRRPEQGLVSLLPGVPRGREFNRRFALALLRDYLTPWALGMAALSLLLVPLGGTRHALVAFGVALLGGGLVLWRDWTGVALIKGWLAVLIYVPIASAAVAARWALDARRLDTSELLLVAALVLVPLYAWRWRVALRAPMAWPAGRRG